LMAGVGGAEAKTPADNRANLVLAHELGHRVLADAFALFFELLVNLGAAVDAVGVLMHRFDLRDQLLSLRGFRRGTLCLSLLPGIKAAAGNLQHLTQQRQRILPTMLCYPGKAGVLWLAKKAVAFFKISFSICRRLTCFSSSATRTFRACGSSGNAASASTRCTHPAFLSHSNSVLNGMPSSRAAAVGSICCTRTKSIACSLNCRV